MLSDGARRFCDHYPTVWHVIEAEGLASAQAVGLLPAAVLRERAGLPASALNRDDFEPVQFDDGRHQAVLRFQQMRDARLARSLQGEFAGSPAKWRAFIDEHVFFWATVERRDKFREASMRERRRSAAAPSAAEPPILALDTAELLARHQAAAVFSRINSGSTMLGGLWTRRDETTFQPVGAYWRKGAAELAIRGPVPLDGLLLPRP